MSKANLIIIGGTIAAGKSSLMINLVDKFGFNGVPEIDENDKMQKIILQKLYEGKRIHKATVEFYFILNRIEQYKNHHNLKTISVLDRSLIEDWIFSLLWLKDDSMILKHFQKLWRASINQIFVDYGRPLFYIFLEINWKTFKERIFQRNRISEISNFSQNKAFFRDLLNAYNNDFMNILKENKINSFKLTTDNLDEEQTLEKISKVLKEQKIV